MESALPNSKPSGTYQMPPDGWVCFHCGERFTTFGAARYHFGATPESKVGCLIDRVALEEGGKPERGRGLLMALRKVEAELSASRQREADLTRQLSQTPIAANPASSIPSSDLLPSVPNGGDSGQFEHTEQLIQTLLSDVKAAEAQVAALHEQLEQAHGGKWSQFEVDAVKWRAHERAVSAGVAPCTPTKDAWDRIASLHEALRTLGESQAIRWRRQGNTIRCTGCSSGEASINPASPTELIQYDKCSEHCPWARLAALLAHTEGIPQKAEQ